MLPEKKYTVYGGMWITLFRRCNFLLGLIINIIQIFIMKITFLEKKFQVFLKLEIMQILKN